ncbi:MAG: aminotransferase class V-fold PLP-dependent enzyme [Ginsengibacter sp.]
MLLHQQHLFNLPGDISYLNCAYMSPLLKQVEEAGIAGIYRKRNPGTIQPEDFFNEAEDIRLKIGRIINAAPQQIAIIPSASYGLQSVVNNLPVTNGNHAVTVWAEFPSGYYAISGWCQQHDKELKIISPPGNLTERGKRWNERIVDAINNDTAIVLMSGIHWADGTKFDLQKIGERCKEVNALFVVDGTQSVGALPMDVTSFHIDALICSGYKWLLAPYSIGFAYFSELFNNGIPVEGSWMNRSNAENFSALSDYVDEYKPGAARYNVGEFSNFILAPMFNKSLEQIIEWNVNAIGEYCSNLIKPLIQLLQEKNFWIEDENYRANHLFGFLLPQTISKTRLLEELRARKIYVSLRGDWIRVSPHVYNIPGDIEALNEVLKTLPIE